MDLQKLCQIATRTSYHFCVDKEDPDKVKGLGNLGDLVLAELKIVYEDTPYDNDAELLYQAELRMVDAADALREIADAIASYPGATGPRCCESALSTEHEVRTPFDV